MNWSEIVLSLVYTKIAGAVPLGLPCKFLNQKCGHRRILKNAHIWSMGAALMRAVAAGTNVQHTPRMMRILFRVTLEDKFRLAVELSPEERWI